MRFSLEPVTPGCVSLSPQSIDSKSRNVCQSRFGGLACCKRGEPQKQLSKEFVREWLMANGFQGLDGQIMPQMPDDFLGQVTDRYIELYENVTGKAFDRGDTERIEERIQDNVITALASL